MASLYTETITWTFEGSAYDSVPGGILMQNLDEDSFETACFPPDFGMYGRAPSSIQVYSPGWCPEGYGTPGVQSFDKTTTLTCCLSSFSYGSTYSSINNFGSSSVLFMGCISYFSGTTVVPARSGNTDLSSQTIFATSSPVTMWAQPITMEYRQGDLSLSDLSTGAKAGIGVGIALGALLLVGALVVFIVLKRWRAPGGKLPPAYNDKKDPSKMGVSELPQNQQARSELVGSQEFPRRELYATGTHADRQRMYELE
ncbi:hypothetical protein DV736_g6433, partial [Chaetothyriales sp. CBS 134916]